MTSKSMKKSYGLVVYLLFDEVGNYLNRFGLVMVHKIFCDAYCHSIIT